VFSETRYALNGDLRVAYRASREGTRDIVSVPNWFTCCEVLPELPSIQGWVEAMTSLGRLIYFDQPGTGASDPVMPGALPTLEQWADSITAVLDALGSREAVLVAIDGAVATGALFAATHPSRATALVVMDGWADPPINYDSGRDPEEISGAMVAVWGTGEFQHAMNPVACKVAGTVTSAASAVDRYAPRCPRNTPRSDSSRTISSAKNGLPEARSAIFWPSAPTEGPGPINSETSAPVSESLSAARAMV
jgi:pimeloyl-ACP methyl ester carboxylesterase